MRCSSEPVRAAAPARQAERPARLRSGDAVDDEPVRALEGAHGAARLPPVDAVGGMPSARCSAATSRAALRPSPPPGAAAAAGERATPARRSRAAGQRERGAEHGGQRAARPRGRRADGARDAKDRLSARMNLAGHHAYGVSCRARAVDLRYTALRRRFAPGASGSIGSPAPLRLGGGDSAGSSLERESIPSRAAARRAGRARRAGAPRRRRKSRAEIAGVKRS